MQFLPFKAGFGPATATGFLFVGKPNEESLVRRTLNILGLEKVSFEAYLAGPAFEATVLGVTVIIQFDRDSREFTGLTEQAETSGRVLRRSTTIVSLV